MGRNRRIICGLIGGALIRLSFDASTTPSKIACIVVSAAFIIFGAISDEKLAKIRAAKRKEWYEKDWDEEEKRWR